MNSIGLEADERAFQVGPVIWILTHVVGHPD